MDPIVVFIVIVATVLFVVTMLEIYMGQNNDEDSNWRN